MIRVLAAGTPATLFAAGLLLLATGLLHWESFAELAGRTMPILLFVAAMTVVTELTDSAGVFRVVTAGRADAAGSRARRRRAGSCCCGSFRWGSPRRARFFCPWTPPPCS